MTATTAQQDDILDALGIGELEVGEQEALLLDLGQLIYKGSLLRVLEGMDEETKQAFETILAGNPTDEEVGRFLAVHAPHADAAVAETIQELRDDILMVTGAGQD